MLLLRTVWWLYVVSLDHFFTLSICYCSAHCRLWNIFYWFHYFILSWLFLCHIFFFMSKRLLTSESCFLGFILIVAFWLSYEFMDISLLLNLSFFGLNFLLDLIFLRLRDSWKLFLGWLFNRRLTLFRLLFGLFFRRRLYDFFLFVFVFLYLLWFNFSSDFLLFLLAWRWKLLGYSFFSRR